MNNEKDSLKWTSKPSYMSQKVSDNDFVVIPKTKVNKQESVALCILDLSKVLMY